MATFTIEELLNNPKMQYDTEPTPNFDWSMMTYDDWKTPAYWASKYPPGFIEQFPGIWEHCEYLAQNAKSPLEEWEDRHKQTEAEAEAKTDNESESDNESK
jgi:hypothetical protein